MILTFSVNCLGNPGILNRSDTKKETLVPKKIKFPFL